MKIQMQTHLEYYNINYLIKEFDKGFRSIDIIKGNLLEDEKEIDCINFGFDVYNNNNNKQDSYFYIQLKKEEAIFFAKSILNICENI